MYYYAVLDEKGIVINILSSQAAITDSTHVQITTSQYNDPDSILGMYFDADTNTFITPPIHVLAETSTSNIQYKSEEKWLDTKLDEIESAIENIELTPGPPGPPGQDAASQFDDYEPSDFASADHIHHKFTNSSSITTYKAVFVSPLGSDNNDGLSQSAPMKTIKAAIRKYAEQYKMLDIKLADGTYTEDIGPIAVDCCNIAIRSINENKDNVLINMITTLESNINQLRLYNVTLKVTNTDSRVLSITGGNMYAYNVRLEVPTSSEFSCLNVYNGATAFIMNSVINSGTASNSGAAVYGNQALLIKSINCTSERKVTTAFHAHNGSDIYYTSTINATTVKKETSYGKCTAR